MGKNKKKNKNPFEIRKAPVQIISAQAVTLDDYVDRFIGRSCQGDYLPCITGE
jgi:hypothetical protein